MDIARCDDCCNVLNGIGDGVTFECDEEVYERLDYEDMCEDCVNSHEDLYIWTDGYRSIVKFKHQEKEETK